MSGKCLFLMAVVFALLVTGPVFAATIMHYSFDGTLGEEVPSGLVDDTGTYTAIIIAGSDADSNITYAQPNPTFNVDGTSAQFYNDNWGDNAGDTFVIPDSGGLDFSTFTEFTVQMFVYCASGQAQTRRIFSEYIYAYMYLDNTNTLHGIRKWGPGSWNENWTHLQYPNLPADQWLHLALVWDGDGTGDKLKLFVDGVAVASDVGTSTATMESSAGFTIGGYQHENTSTRQYFFGRIDEFRMSDVALEPEDFLLYGGGGAASYPTPSHGTDNVCPELVLSWTPGEGVGLTNGHDVYIGTDYNDVYNADTSTPFIYKGRQDTNSYPESGSLSLEFATSYYWRIDEVNETDLNIAKGDVWRFTTETGKASVPSPADQDMGVAPDTQLSWTAGCLADSHDVYLGTNLSDVNNAVTTSDEYKDNTIEATYDPGILDNYTTYFWRIDEVSDGNRIKGDVWVFTTRGDLADPNLMLWYKFDEVAPTSLVADSSGRGYHGQVRRVSTDIPIETAWDASGYYAGCIDFDGDTKVVVPPQAFSQIDSAITVALWVNGDSSVQPDPNWGMPFHGGNPTNDRLLHTHIPTRYGDVMFESGSYNAQRLFWLDSEPADWEGEWNHYAFTLDSDQQIAKIFHNGAEAARHESASLGVGGIQSFTIGCGIFAGGTAYEYFGKVDDFRVYDWALSESEIGKFAEFAQASAPYPRDGATGVPLDVVLTWKPGMHAADPGAHEVYFGTSWEDVNDADTTWPVGTSVYKGSQDLDVNSYDPVGLTANTTYYWRIDEVNTPLRWRGRVWSFRSISVPIDPNLMAWYELDESEGETARDSSGHDNDAHVDGPSGGPEWDPTGGHFGGALVFDDNTDVEMPTAVLGKLSEAISVSLWLKDAHRPGNDNWVFEAAEGDYGVQAAVVESGTGQVLWRAGNDTNDVLRWNLDGANPATLEGWHHWVFIKNEVVDEITIYFDSEPAESNATVDHTLANLRSIQMRLGVGAGHTNDFVGRMDDFRLYDRALSPEEVAILFRGGALELAWNPNPYDGQRDVRSNVVLTWKPGDYAAQHKVFFGTSWDDVNSATVPDATKDLGDEEYDPGLLELTMSYYWRIDEVNGPNTWTGTVWRFSVADFLIVDDVESYNAIPGSGNEIYNTWDDGFSNSTGSQLELEYGSGATVRSGDQSMKMQYNNAIAYHKYSEIDANTTGPRPGNLEIGSDWTRLEVKGLTLFFYGTADNDANEQMYVALEDSARNIHISKYGTMGEDMNDIRQTEWHQWDIPLSDFGDAGVTLTDVNKVRIGFGDRDNPAVGGSGTVFFDDIRLYLPKCVPWIVKPEADISNNCIVDFEDVMMLAADWLEYGYGTVNATAPDADKLILRYQFEDTSGSTITDSTVPAYNGTFFTDVNQVPAEISGRVDPGKYGNSFHFSVPIATAGISIPNDVFVDHSLSQEITVSMWIKNAHPNETPDAGAFMWEFRQWDGNSTSAGARVLAVEVTGRGDDYGFRDDDDSVWYEHDWDDHLDWQHYAFVRDADYLEIYVDGLLESRDNSSGNSMAIPGLLYLGTAADRAPGNISGMHDGFTGNVDDFRIYSYALSYSEVVSLADQVSVYDAVDSPANLHEPGEEETVDFKDFAVIADGWLEEILWPQ